MRLNEVTGYSLKELLTEIDRRGFLKGLSAAAATAAIPSLAKAGDKKDPFDSVDQVEPPKKQKPVTGGKKGTNRRKSKSRTGKKK